MRHLKLILSTGKYRIKEEKKSLYLPEKEKKIMTTREDNHGTYIIITTMKCDTYSHFFTIKHQRNVNNCFKASY